MLASVRKCENARATGTAWSSGSARSWSSSDSSAWPSCCRAAFAIRRTRSTVSKSACPSRARSVSPSMSPSIDTSSRSGSVRIRHGGSREQAVCLQERADRGKEARILFARVDVPARDFDELLRRRRRVEQLASLLERNDGVLRAVQEQDRRADPCRSSGSIRTGCGSAGGWGSRDTAARRSRRATRARLRGSPPPRPRATPGRPRRRIPATSRRRRCAADPREAARADSRRRSARRR